MAPIYDLSKVVVDIIDDSSDDSSDDSNDDDESYEVYSLVDDDNKNFKDISSNNNATSNNNNNINLAPTLRRRQIFDLSGNNIKISTQSSFKEYRQRGSRPHPYFTRQESSNTSRGDGDRHGDVDDTTDNYTNDNANINSNANQNDIVNNTPPTTYDLGAPAHNNDNLMNSNNSARQSQTDESYSGDSYIESAVSESPSDEEAHINLLQLQYAATHANSSNNDISNSNTNTNLRKHSCCLSDDDLLFDKTNINDIINNNNNNNNNNTNNNNLKRKMYSQNNDNKPVTMEYIEFLMDQSITLSEIGFASEDNDHDDYEDRTRSSIKFMGSDNFDDDVYDNHNNNESGDNFFINISNENYDNENNGDDEGDDIDADININSGGPLPSTLLSDHL